MVIKSLLEEQAETIAEEALLYDQTQMASEDHMSKAWELQQKLVESDALRVKMENAFAAQESKHGVMKKIALTETSEQVDLLATHRDELSSPIKASSNKLTYQIKKLCH